MSNVELTFRDQEPWEASDGAVFMVRTGFKVAVEGGGGSSSGSSSDFEACIAGFYWRWYWRVTVAVAVEAGATMY
jgi:hypothetical protein